MGGSGSGRRTFSDTVEDCRCLDVNWMMREGYIKAGWHRTGSVYWSRNGERVASIGYEARMDESPPFVRLIYTVDQTEKFDYRVGLTATYPHLGGVRWWFVCPARGCGRRVGKLLKAPGVKYFVCRHCLGIGYQSQRQAEMFRALEKAQKIRERLGGSTCTWDPFPEKPKRMHWTTYEKLRRKCKVAEDVCDLAEEQLVSAWKVRK